MNLPSGRVVKAGVDVASLDFYALVKELGQKTFSGYVALSVKGAGGFEEGTLVFDSGKVVASVYDYAAHGRSVAGERAFPRVLNAAAARHGTLDIVQLTPEQVKLVLAFNEAAVFLPSERAFRDFRAESFSPAFEQELASQKPPAKDDVMKKLGISEIKREMVAAPAPEDPLAKLAKKA